MNPNTDYLSYYLLSGGNTMFVIVPCSILLLGIVIQSMIRLRRGRVIPSALLEKAAAVRDARGRDAFAETAAGQHNPLARVLQRTLREIDRAGGERKPHRELAPIIEDAVAHVADDMYEQIGTFSTLFTIGPLLGLYGTIMGMMRAFNKFGGEQEKNLSTLSEGIREALVTTLWGLGIAIAAFIAAQIFQGKIRKYERVDLPDKTQEIVDALYASADRREAREEAPPEPESRERQIALELRGSLERAASERP